MNDEGRAISFQRKLGNHLLDTLSHNAVASPLDAITEFVANSYDADAREVDIHISNQGIIIADDGHGMSPEGLNLFYCVGDSTKKLQKHSPKGRAFLGSFGIAKLGLRTLGGEYSVTSRQGETCTVTREKFQDRMRLEDVIEGQVFPNQDGKSGTTIEIRDLIVPVSPEFDAYTIAKHLSRTLGQCLVGDDFNISVNGLKVKSHAIENATKFAFEQKGEHAGDIIGTFYLTGTQSNESGIYINVNGRNIGNPKELLEMDGVHRSLRRTVIAKINAHGMEPFIRQDRGDFRPSKARSELLESIASQLKEIRRFKDQQRESGRADRLGTIKERVLAEAISHLRGARIDEVKARKVVFSTDVPSYLPGIVRDSQILLNEFHPAIQERNARNASGLKDAFTTALLDTIAGHRAQREGTFDAFAREKALLIDDLYRDRNGATHKPEIFGNVHYTGPTLAKLSGMPLESVRYLINRGLVPEVNDEVLGRDFVAAQNAFLGLVPLPTVLKGYTSSGPSEANLQRLEEIFPTVGETRPFIVNRGKGKACYGIAECCVREVANVLETFDLRRTEGTVRHAFEAYASEYLSLDKAAERLKIKGGVLAESINYATEKKLPLRKPTDGSDKYMWRDIVNAVQENRINKG